MLEFRVITASILALFVGGMLFLGNMFWWQMLMLLVTFIIGYEWSGFAKKEKLVVKLSWGVAFLVSVLLVGFVIENRNFSLYLLLTPLVVMVVTVLAFQIREGKQIVENPFLLFILGILVIYPFHYSMIEIKQSFSAQIILLSFFTIWAVDTGAYFSGRRFGKHKLASFVSPGKSWEGVYGGIALSFVIAYLGLLLVEPPVSISSVYLALILSIIGALSIFGDLFESLLKRQVGMKDSSQILPGHGGVLDRLDSLILAMPLYLITWQWVT